MMMSLPSHFKLFVKKIILIHTTNFIKILNKGIFLKCVVFVLDKSGYLTAYQQFYTEHL